MKRLLSIILLAAALAASPVAGQTIKSLGYNTTNGQVVYSGTNSLTFTNSLQFSTNARAATRTNLGATTVGNAVFTATNAAAAATAIGLGTNNDVNFNRVQVGGASFTTNGFSGGNFTVTASHALTFGSGGDPAITRTNLGLGETNAVTFSNITASGTLAVTNNATLSGTANLAPSQTADSGDSLMTRGLTDVRYPTSVFITQSSDNQTVTNGGFKFVAPSRINAFSLGYGASVPSGFTQFRVILSFGLTSDPATNSTNFPVFVRFNNMNAVNNNPIEAEHASLAGVVLYPTNDTGLTGTMTRRGAFVSGGTTNAVYSFISDFVTIPSAWQSNAVSNGMYHFIGVAVRNNTGGSITDGFTYSHVFVGLIEFRK